MTEAAAYAWANVGGERNGSGRACVEGNREDTYRVVSADTMKLLLPIRRGAG